VKTALEHTIDTELSQTNLRFLPEYLRRFYILKNDKYRTFENVEITTENGINRLVYRVVVPKTNQHVDVQVKATVPITMTLSPSDPNVAESFLEQLQEDVFLEVQEFEENVRKTALYLAFVPGEKIVPEKEGTRLHIRVFSDSMLFLYIILLGLTFVLFLFLGDYAPLVFVVLSFILAMFAGKLIGRSGDWKITEKQPEIYLLQYILPSDKFEELRKNLANKIPQIRKAIYDATLAVNRTPSCEAASEAFKSYGIDCQSDNFTVKKVNLHEIVKSTANQFGISAPPTVVVNTVIPNAAASGPNSKLGAMMVTTGIMMELEEDELKTVIGHELSHLRAHDPLVMSTIFSIEFLLRFYVFLPYLFFFGLISFWLYFILALGVIFFFGKFLESRADLDSANVLGKPKVLAEALRKIAFKRLFPLYKREPEFSGYRRMEWLQLDPHPPIYFRIAQLDSLEEPVRIQHTFLMAMKDNLRGFLRA
jgi:heat shock protein HtpX